MNSNTNNSGFVKLYRDLLTSDLWYNLTNDQRTVLMIVLAGVNSKMRKVPIAGTMKEIKAGQWLTSTNVIIEKSRNYKGALSRDKVETALKQLQKLGFLDIETNPKHYTILTVLNWERDQANPKNSNFFEEAASEQQAETLLLSGLQEGGGAKDTQAKQRKPRKTPATNPQPIRKKTIEEAASKQQVITPPISGLQEGSITDNPQASRIEQTKKDQSYPHKQEERRKNFKYLYNNYPSINQSNNENLCNGIDSIDTLFVDQIKFNIGYDELLKAHNKSEIDNIINLAYDLLSVVGETVKIGDKIYSKDYATKVLLSLNGEKIAYILDKLKDIGKYESIKNPKRYVQSVVFNVALNYDVEFREMFNRTYYNSQ